MAGVEDRRWSYVPDELRGRYDEEFGSIPNAVRVVARRHPALEAMVDGDVRMIFADVVQIVRDRAANVRLRIVLQEL